MNNAMLRKLLTERTCGIALILVFILISTWLLSIPYDPMSAIRMRGPPDEPTILTWSELYLQGKYSVPLEEFIEKKYPAPQSVVVEKNGEYWVANEKGPGYCVLLAGLIFLRIAPFVILLLGAITCISTYFLAKRLFNWKVAIISTLFVMTSADALLMLQRWGHPDYATMAFAVLGLWLVVESFYKFKQCETSSTRSALLTGILLGISSGVALAFSVTTRYAVVFLLVVPVIYFLASNYKLRKQNFRMFIKSTKFLLPYIIGVLIPMLLLLNYNATILGNPFTSGYNFTQIIALHPETMANITSTSTRDPTGSWSLLNLPENIVEFTPLFAIGMPVILFVPYALFKLKKDKTLWLFAPWFLAVFLFYMPVGWVGDQPFLIAHVRYFLPALPMLCLCAGYAIETARKDAVFAFCVAGALVFAGIACAQMQFEELGSMGKGPSQGPPQQNVYQSLTIAQLLANPSMYKEKPVRVENAQMTLIKHPDSQTTLLHITDNTTSRNITVAIETVQNMPQLSINDTVNVQGVFRPGMTNQQEDINGEWAILIRVNTEDIVEKS